MIVIADRAQDRSASFQGEHHPEVSTNAKFEVIPLQSPDTKPVVGMRLTKRARQMTKRLIKPVDLLIGQLPRLITEASGVLNP